VVDFDPSFQACVLGDVEAASEAEAIAKGEDFGRASCAIMTVSENGLVSEGEVQRCLTGLDW
jgi:hypothetical protein